VQVYEALTRIKAIEAIMFEAAKHACTEYCEETMKISQEQYCPFDTGALHDSGKVETTKDTLSEFEVTLSYGGGDVDYAVYVHE
jgi:hypothetical protein